MSNPEKSKPPTSEEDALTRMGTKRILEELRQKYGLAAPADQEAESNNKIGTSRVLADLQEKSRKFAKALEGVPYHSETIPAAEIREVVMARKICLGFVEHSEQYVHNLKSRFGQGAEFEKKKKEYLQSELANLEHALDALPIWRKKFSTEGEGGGVASESNESLTINSEMDSIYYITPHGSSLRLKKSIIADGLDMVASRFAEKIFFVGKTGKISVQPIEKFTVREYFTEKFSNCVRDENVSQDFHSHIRTYEKDGDIRAIVMPEDDTNEPHVGDRVNKIFKKIKGKGWK